jgi:4a-hydroxytetrahydrobiopterin dehydratase
VSEPITPRQFHDAAGTEDWRVIGEGACTCFRTGSFAAGTRLAQAIGELPSEHPPDLDLRADAVTVRLITITDQEFGLSSADVELAREISAVARRLGVAADPSSVQTVQVTIDALVSTDVMPFWRAVLGYEPAGEEDLVDPHTGGPALWFQDMDAPRPQRNRIHLDLCLAPELVEARVAAGVAAGGRIVFDKGAPMWWTLADPEGNEVDITSMAHRD